MRKMLEACGIPCNVTIVGAIYLTFALMVFYVGCHVEPTERW